MFLSLGSARNAAIDRGLGTFKPRMRRICQARAISSVGFSRFSAALRMSLRTCARFCRNWGLSSSQLGTEKISNLALNGACRLELSVDELALGRLALGRGAETRLR